jgi:hypothetical protein
MRVDGGKPWLWYVDGKWRTQNLRRSRRPGTLNRNPRAVVDPLFRERGFIDSCDLLRVRYEMVRRHQVDDVPVAMTAQQFGGARFAPRRARRGHTQMAFMPAKKQKTTGFNA